MSIDLGRNMYPAPNLLSIDSSQPDATVPIPLKAPSTKLSSVRFLVSLFVLFTFRVETRGDRWLDSLSPSAHLWEGLELLLVMCCAFIWSYGFKFRGVGENGPKNIPSPFQFTHNLISPVRYDRPLAEFSSYVTTKPCAAPTTHSTGGFQLNFIQVSDETDGGYVRDLGLAACRGRRLWGVHRETPSQVSEYFLDVPTGTALVMELQIGGG